MQSFEYTNRKGITYYLHARPGRAGMTLYALKRSNEGALVRLPAGYEVVENVNGQASIRRVRSRQITSEEEAEVRSSLARRRLEAYQVEVKDAQITIFEADRNAEELAVDFNPFGMLPGGIGIRLRTMLGERVGDKAVEQYVRERQERLRETLKKATRYAPVMRFRLVDRKRRSFEVARMTYLGEGGWRVLEVLPLAAAAKRYVKHLGRDSFFELI